MDMNEMQEKVRVGFELIGDFIFQVTSFLAARRSGGHDVSCGSAGSLSRIEELFRSMFADRLAETIKWVGLILVLALTVDYLFLELPKQVYGLILDLSGAVIVARGLFRGAEEIRASAGGPTTTGYSRSLLGMTTENEGIASPEAIEVGSSVDGIIGSTLLCTGFLVQIWAITF